MNSIRNRKHSNGSNKSSESELQELFTLYSANNNDYITLDALQQCALDYKFTVSAQQISQFFGENTNTNNMISFIEFAQFVRHQESTLKKLFHAFKQYKYNEVLSKTQIKTEIKSINNSKLHYFWRIDDKWVDTIFQGINQRRKLGDNTEITYLDFRKEALLQSTSTLHRYYRASTDRLLLDNNKSLFENDDILIDGLSKEELRHLFDTLSRGKGVIDIRTLCYVVRETKIPISQHQLMQFFYRCDVTEDGCIDFIEFCHFMKSEEEAIRNMFDELDLNRDRFLSASEIRRSLHVKYIEDHAEDLSKDFVTDLKEIDQWINAIIEHIKSVQTTNTDNDTKHDQRISYEEFVKFATLSGARSLLSMIQPYSVGMNSKSNRFLFDFDINLPQTIDVEFDKKRSRKLNIITFISGTFAGVISRTLTAPVDRVKLMMQLKSHGSIGSHVFNIMNESNYTPKVFAFWRGNLTNCIKMAPETAIKFTAHSIILSKLRQKYSKDHRKRNHFSLNFIAGAGAGAISQTLIYPLEIAKTRLALSNHGQYRNFIDCIYSTAKHEGVRSLYNGWTASVTGIMPYCAIEMGVFFTIKDWWMQRYEIEPDLFTLFGMGGAASISGTMVAYPFQLVRTKLQTQGMPNMKNVKYKGMFDCFKHTWKNFGIFGLYSGLIPNFAKAIPASCISYVVVEKTRNFFKQMADIE